MLDTTADVSVFASEMAEEGIRVVAVERVSITEFEEERVLLSEGIELKIATEVLMAVAELLDNIVKELVTLSIKLVADGTSAEVGLRSALTVET